MQSTLKTPTTPAIRPKVGRPPVAEVLEHPMAAMLRRTRERERLRFDLRFLAGSVILVVAVAFTLGRLLAPSLETSGNTLVSPATADTGIKASVSEKNEKGSLVGDFAVMKNGESAVTYSAQHTGTMNEQERNRLLSILSKD